ASGSHALGGYIGIKAGNADGTVIGGALGGQSKVISRPRPPLYPNRATTPTTGPGKPNRTHASRPEPNPKFSEGILLQTEGSGSIIGGVNSGEGNTIAFNCGIGVGFSSGHDWPLLGNSIFANRALGISLSNGEIPYENDTGDVDSGPNKLQNYP